MSSRATLLPGCLSLLLWFTGCVSDRGSQKNFTRELSTNQIQKLALRILQNTPEHTHWQSGTRFAWVLTSWKDDPGPEGLEEAVLKNLHDRYKVYRSEPEIDDAYVVKGWDGRIVRFKDGFSFSYSVLFEDEETVKVTYSDWEGNLAGSYHWTRYRWTGHEWEILEKSQMLVA